MVSKSQTERNSKHLALFDQVYAIGALAAKDAVVDPMFVRDARTDETWTVEGGPCGFAWVNIRPGTSSFARWLVSEGHAHKSYDGGVDIWIGDYGQSMQRKGTHASAMAAELRDQGVTAYALQRMD